MAQQTLLDIAKLNNNDKLVGLIEENLTYAPEVSIFPIRTIKGTTYNTVVRTGFPSVGFRTANAGHTPGKSTFDKRQVQTFIFGGVIQVDKAVAAAYEDGPAAWEMLEASGVVKNAIIKLGAQCWYGVSTDANGFPGIKSLVAKGSTIAVDATGTTATTASSFYAVKFGVQDVTLVAGQGGSMILSDFQDQQVADAATSGAFIPSRVADLTAWTGLQAGNVNCVGRILNLTEDSGKGLTDTLIAKLLALFPVGYRPDAFFGSRRSLRQLQVSRSVTLFNSGGTKIGSGMENIAPWPDSAFGVPIYATDSILNTDTVE